MLQRFGHLCVASLFIAEATHADTLEPGGPLAGVRLPPAKTHFGEAAGHPGCIADLSKAAKPEDDGYVPFTAQHFAPELELYPGSVEHYRSYRFKFVPVRSFFDQQSQLKNWSAPNIPGATAREEYAVPLYWVPRYGLPRDTGKKLAPVPVIRCKAQSPMLRLDLGDLTPGLFAVRVIGSVETAKLRPFRLPLYPGRGIDDGVNGERSTYRIRAGYVDEPYSMAEIYFQAPANRPYHAELSVDQGSDVELLVHNITLDDALAGTTRCAIKPQPAKATPAVNPKISSIDAAPGLAYLARPASNSFKFIAVGDEEPGEVALVASIDVKDQC